MVSRSAIRHMHMSQAEILGPHHCLQRYLHHISLGLPQFLWFWRGEVVSVGETVIRVTCWYYHLPTEEWIAKPNQLLHSVSQ